MRAITSSLMPWGHTASHSPWLEQAPKPRGPPRPPARGRGARSGWPRGRRPRWPTLGAHEQRRRAVGARGHAGRRSRCRSLTCAVPSAPGAVQRPGLAGYVTGTGPKHGDGTQARGARRRRAFMLPILRLRHEPAAGGGGASSWGDGTVDLVAADADRTHGHRHVGPNEAVTGLPRLGVVTRVSSRSAATPSMSWRSPRSGRPASSS